MGCIPYPEWLDWLYWLCEWGLISLAPFIRWIGWCL